LLAEAPNFLERVDGHTCINSANMGTFMSTTHLT
jgi:hypothetical protein